MPFELSDLARPESPIGQMFNGSPESQAALLQMGLSMLGPQAEGAGYGQEIFGGLADGLNYLQALEANRNEGDLAQRKQAVAEQNADSDTLTAQSTADAQGRLSDARDVGNAIDLYNSETERGRVELVFRAAQGKIDGEQDKIKMEAMKSLLSIQKARVEQGLPMDTEQFMSTWNLIQEGWKPDQIIWDGKGYVAKTSAFGDIDEESGERKNQYRELAEHEVAIFGGDPAAIRAQGEKSVKTQADKSVSDVSQVEPRKDADGKIIIGKEAASSSSASSEASPAVGTAAYRESLEAAVATKAEREAEEAKLPDTVDASSAASAQKYLKSDQFKRASETTRRAHIEALKDILGKARYHAAIIRLERGF